MTKAVLSLCDKTGNIVRPWANAGYTCYCVDIQHQTSQKGQLASEDVGQGKIHYIPADVLTYLPPRLDYKIAFAAPPCTDLAVSGARWFKDKGLPALINSLTLVDRCRQLLTWTDAPYLLENPIGTLATYWREPDYYFDPCEYGGYLVPPADAYRKRTALWTGNGFVMPETKPIEPIKACRQGSYLQRLGGKSQKTKDIRSATPMGFAAAVYEANK